MESCYGVNKDFLLWLIYSKLTCRLLLSILYWLRSPSKIHNASSASNIRLRSSQRVRKSRDLACRDLGLAAGLGVPELANSRK